MTKEQNKDKEKTKETPAVAKPTKEPAPRVTVQDVVLAHDGSIKAQGEFLSQLSGVVNDLDQNQRELSGKVEAVLSILGTALRNQNLSPPQGQAKTAKETTEKEKE